MFTRRLFTLSALLPLNAGATEIAQALHAHDYVLLMRHAYAPGVGDPPNYSLDRCEGQRLLNDEGKRQAVRNGDWLRESIKGTRGPAKSAGAGRGYGPANAGLA